MTDKLAYRGIDVPQPHDRQMSPGKEKEPTRKVSELLGDTLRDWGIFPDWPNEIYSLSDIHLGSKSTLESELKDAIGKIIATERHEDRPVKLVLNGDICDDWVYPAEIEPPSYEEILRNNEWFCKLLNKVIEAGIDVIYCRGNHDNTISSEVLTQWIPNIKFEKVGYICNPVIFMHGHQFTFFNDDRKCKRPLGYWITRIVTALRDRAPGLIQHYGVIERAVEDSEEDVCQFLRNLARRCGVDRVVTREEGVVLIDQIGERFTHLSGRLKELLDDIVSERKLVSKGAREAAVEHKTPVVVLGHTHRPELKRISESGIEIIYANTGCFCDPCDIGVICISPEDESGRVVNVRLFDSSGAIKEKMNVRASWNGVTLPTTTP